MIGEFSSGTSGSSGGIIADSGGASVSKDVTGAGPRLITKLIIDPFAACVPELRL